MGHGAWGMGHGAWGMGHGRIGRGYKLWIIQIRVVLIMGALQSVCLKKTNT